MLMLITFNHALTLFILFGLFYYFPSFVRVDIKDMPTLGRFFLDIVVCAVCYDILFFSIHRYHFCFSFFLLLFAYLIFGRTLHLSPILYQWIHKRHHQFTAPSSFSAIYAHPIEHLVGNILPVLAGNY